MGARGLKAMSKTISGYEPVCPRYLETRRCIMRRRSVFVTVVLVLVLLSTALLGCSEKASYGPAQVHFPEDEGAHPRIQGGVVVFERHRVR